MTDTPSDKNKTQGPAARLEKGFSSARPVLFGPEHYFLKVNAESGDVWIVHDVPLDLDLTQARFDESEGLLFFDTATGESFEMGVTIKDILRPKIARATRVTLIYIPGEDLENMIFIPLVQTGGK